MAVSAVPGTGTTAAGAAGAAAVAEAVTSKNSIAQNFEAFLRLLTTQLKNQNPLDPLDTNQFTQQLVQFAQVEQQINMNTSLGSLIALQKASQTSAALGFLGATVRVDGDTARLANGAAAWAFEIAKPATVTINVTNAAGQVVHSESGAVAAGPQAFTWNGRDAAGRTWPDGDYRISVVAKDASGQPVAVSTEVEGVVDGIDLSQSPPTLSVGGQTFTLDKIKQVRRTGA
jgi:flagellar basal-body rod modification protein FlgD